MGALTFIRNAVGLAEMPPSLLAESVQEARSKEVALTPAPLRQIRRSGYEYGIPLGTVATSMQVARTSERQQIMVELYQAYLQCNWLSAGIDVVARTVTAGGLQIVSDEDLPEGEVPPDTPEITELRRLLKFTNPREDLIQLMRNAIVDLQLFGDAYIEIVTLLGHPVALYTLDATTMTVIADQHGEVLGYSQDVDGLRTAKFGPDQVIHISLDAPRGGLYGIGPAQKALLPVTAWLFWMSTLQECGRRGDPPRIHVDLAHLQDKDIQIWREMYRVFNLGPKALGEPVVTTGGGMVNVLDARKVSDYLDAEKVLRDQIISALGVPPAKLGIIETGNIGGGTGESQNRTFEINTIIPIANLLLEKFNYHLLQVGFGITDYHLEFKEIDYRDSQIVENIRDLRLRNGSFTLNRYRDEIGEPPVDGGDDAVMVDRQGIIMWADMGRYNEAFIANLAAPAATAGLVVPVESVPEPEPEPEPVVVGAVPGAPGLPPAALTAPPAVAQKGADDLPETALQRDARRLDEAWEHAYRARRKRALKELP